MRHKNDFPTQQEKVEEHETNQERVGIPYYEAWIDLASVDRAMMANFARQAALQATLTMVCSEREGISRVEAKRIVLQNIATGIDHFARILRTSESVEKEVFR